MMNAARNAYDRIDGRKYATNNSYIIRVRMEDGSWDFYIRVLYKWIEAGDELFSPYSSAY